MAGLATEKRVIAHFDIDCFYAQSEELRCPSLQGRPVGVTQKFLVVTSNYVARGLGVPKMVSIDEAKRKLPSLVLVNGEDLTPYRAESKQITAVLKRFGTVERHGLDEQAVDITARVLARLQSGPPALSFSGHVLGMDAMGRTTSGQQRSTLVNFGETELNWGLLLPGDASLLVGSQVVSEIRAIIEKETGFRCSCGIAQNKMLAKLASSLNKPSMQTCLLQGAVSEFIEQMSTRKIPGVGKQMQGVLSDIGVETIADLKNVTMAKLSERLGDRSALFLFNACRGQDLTPVQDKGPPKSISVEDSFRKCHTMQHAVQIFRVLAPDLIRRLDEDREETLRRPKTFTLKWRVQGPKWSFTSVSTQMPMELLSTSVATEKRAFTVVDVATKLLSRSLGQSFNLAVLNIGATNFVNDSEPCSPCVNDIRNFMQGHGKIIGKELKVISKRDARANRESFKPMATTLQGGAAMPPTRTSPSGMLGRGTLHDLDVLEDAEYLSMSKKEEELDDRVDRFRLSPRQITLNQMYAGAKHCKGRTLSFEESDISSHKLCLQTEKGSVGKQDAELTGRAESSAPSFVSKGATSSLNSPMLQRDENLPLQSSHHKPSHCIEPNPKAVPVSRELFHGAADHSALDNVSGPDIQLMDIKAESKLSSPLMEDNTINTSVRGGKSTKRASFCSEQLPSRVEGSKSTSGLVNYDWSVCEKCGETFEDSESGRQEHADYHFALSLDKEEKQQQHRIPESSRRKSGERDKLERPVLKKPKSRNGTLDGFVVHLP